MKTIIIYAKDGTEMLRVMANSVTDDMNAVTGFDIENNTLWSFFKINICGFTTLNALSK